MGEKKKYPPRKVKAWATTASIGELVQAVHQSAGLKASTKDEAFAKHLGDIIDAAKWEIGARCWEKQGENGGGEA